MILSILKVIGIILLVILGLIIVILSLVLFVPIRYQFEGKYQEEFDGDACVKWSPILFKLSVAFHDNRLEYVVKMFGGVVMTNTDARISWIGKKFFPSDEEDVKEDIDEAVDEGIDEVVGEDIDEAVNEGIDEAVGEDIDETVDEDIKHAGEMDSLWMKPEGDTEIRPEETEDKDKPQTGTSSKTKIRKKIALWKKRWQDFVKKLKEIGDKKDALLKIYRGKGFALAKQDVIRYIKEAFRIIKPDRLEGFIYFGVEDPAITGQILGVLAMLLIFYQDYLTIQPDFTKSCLEASIKGKGKIVVFLIAKLAIKVILNKNLIKVTKKVQTIIEA